jgi:hypothetical protein
MKRTDLTILSRTQTYRSEGRQRAPKGKAKSWALVAVGLAAILMLSIGAKAHSFHAFSTQFLPLVVSIVPANGDQNPYGVVFVPFGFHGGAQPGDILVSNFNNAANEQGTGHTIVRVQPGGQTSVFADTGSVIGLTDALGVSRMGFVFVGSVFTNMGDVTTVMGGPLLVLDSNGKVVDSITSPLDGPWGLALNDTDEGIQVFVSNVLNGTVTRLEFSVSDKGSISLTNSTQIASGYSHTLDPLAVVIGPAGLAYNQQIDTLYVAAEDDDKIFAIPNASQTSDKGEGTLVFSDPHLRGPLGLAIAPNGDLLAANNDSINSDPTQPSEIVEFTVTGKFVSEFSIDNNIDGPFGIAIENLGHTSPFAYLNDNKNTLTVWNVGSPASGNQNEQ